MSDLISIIVPIYNVETYIEKGIAAICSQTYQNLEIILIDDGSTDRSGMICDEFAQKDSRIKVEHIKNSGQSHARNVGLSHATGEWIGFVDGDDFPLPHMYESLHNLAVSNQAQIVECNFVGRNSPPPDEIEEEKLILMSGREALRRQLDIKIFSRYPSTSVWSKLFHHSVLKGITFPDGLIHEEYAMLCEALLRCRQYIYVNQILYNRTLRPDSTTKEKFSVRSLDKLIVHKMRNQILENQKEKELLFLSKAQEYNLLLHFYNRTLDSGMEEENRKLEEELDKKKDEILRSGLPLKKKLIFSLFYFHKGLYRKIRELPQHGDIKKNLIVSACLGFLFSLFSVLGWKMEEQGRLTVSFTTVLLLIVLAILFTVIISFLYKRIEQQEQKRKETAQKRLKKKSPPFIAVQAVMIFCWIPVLLAGYPGFFCYDASDQLKQVTEGIYSVHHPLTHTLLLGKTILFIKEQTGSYELGVLFFCVFQMLITTAIFTKIILWIEKKTTSRFLLLGAFCFYAFYPTIVLFGLCTTKDSLFTAMTTLCMLSLYDLTEDCKGAEEKKSKKTALLFFCSLTASFLLRNNGIYTWVLFFVVLFITQRNRSKAVFFLTAPAIVLAVLINGAAARTLKAENTDGFREMLSVPAQQLARVYNQEGSDFFSDEKLASLYSFIPEWDIVNYNEKLSDPIKANLKVGMNSSIKDFTLLWIKTGLKAPRIYLEAFFMQTYQVWYPLTIPDGYCGENGKPRYQESASCYFAFDPEEPLNAKSLLPGLGTVYRQFSRQMTFQTVPVVPVLFSIGSMLWLHLFLGGYAIIKKRNGALALFLLLLCSVLTCMLGPITLVRYYLILFYSLPLHAAACFVVPKRITN